MIQQTATGRGVRSINEPPVICREDRRRSRFVTDPTKPGMRGSGSRGSRSEPQPSSNALAVQHLGLVKQMAVALGRQLAACVSIDDLVGAGSLGLIEAARRFDPKKASFGTFARHRIRGAMIDSLRAIDPLSRQQRSRVRKVDMAVENLTATLGRTPSTDEIVKRLGISLKHWERMSLKLCGAISTGHGRSANQPISPDDLPTGWQDPERHTAMVRLRELLHDVINGLPLRHQSVIRLYYFSGWTMKRIATECGVTEGRASQIHRAALVQLQTQLASRNCCASDI